MIKITNGKLIQTDSLIKYTDEQAELLKKLIMGMKHNENKSEFKVEPKNNRSR